MRGIAFRLTMTLSAAWAVAALAAGSAAAKGWLDPSFGPGDSHGRVTVTTNFDGEAWDEVQVSSASSTTDKRIYVLAGNAIFAFQYGGARAGAFGGGLPSSVGLGVIAVPAPDGEQLRLEGIAVDSLGRVIVAGTTRQDLPPGGVPNRYPPFPAAEQAERAFVARYLANGAPDPSFGQGGLVHTDLGLPAPPESQTLLTGATQLATRVSVRGLAVDAENRVVLTGQRTATWAVCGERASIWAGEGWEPFLARLADDGSPDPSFTSGAFGVPGVATLGFEGTTGALAVDSGGGAYFLTKRFPVCEGAQATELLARFGPDGQPDPNFAAGGWKHLPSGTNHVDPFLAVDRYSRPVLIGWRTRKPAPYLNIALRLRTDGQRDPRFGKKGIAKLPFAKPGEVELHGLLASGAATYVVGTWWPGGRNHLSGPEDSRRFFIGRIDRKGRADRRFGHGGWVATRFGHSSEAVGRSVLVEPQGTPVLAGTLATPRLGRGTGLGLAGYRRGS